jgi:hypothetical protein
VAVVSDGTAALGHGVNVCNRRVAESVANAAGAIGVARRDRRHPATEGWQTRTAPRPIANSIAPAEAGE